jgi:hypothetical protein
MRWTLGVALTVAVLTGCGGDETSDYCESVKEHQRALSDIAASTEPGALFGALDAYRDLRAVSPRDLRDEWSQVIGRLEALERALDEAGVDPAAYEPKSALATLPPAQRTAIRGAARDLGDEATVAAMAGIEQQALDVCKMPLSQ